MKTEHKFMIGNEFEYKQAKPDPGVLTLLFRNTFFSENYNTDITVENTNKLILTGITSDYLFKLAIANRCLIVLRVNGLYTETGFLTVEMCDATFELKSSETNKQIFLRVAKEMGWV